MRTPRRSLVAATLAVALLGSACIGDDDDDSDDSSPDSTTITDEPGEAPDDGDEPAELEGEGLTLGFIRAPVGLFGILGSAQAGGLALAVEDVAAGGGVLGGPLAISEQQPTPERDVMTVFDELVADGNSLIVGPSSSEEALMLIPQLASADALVCGASTTAPGLPQIPEAEGHFLRTTFDDNIVAVNAFDRIRQQTASVLGRAPKVTIVARGDAYGDSVSGSLAGLLSVVGMELTVLRYDPEDQLLESTAAEAAAAASDVTVVISLAEGPRLARQIVDAGVPAPTVLGLDGMASPRFTGKANITDTAPYQDLTVIGATGPLDFLTRLLDRPESDDEVLYAAQAYDCAIAFALAVESAGSTDAGDVSQALRDVTGGGAVCTSYAQCAALLRDGQDIDYDGPSGPVDFTEEGETGGGRILTARLTDDTLRVVADLRITLDEIRSRVAPRIAGFIGDIQVALTQLGYYTGPIDGQQNDEFREAVAAFQADNGLESTGELDAETIAAIQAALAERGLLLSASIRDVQQLLTELGFYTGPIDGMWSTELSEAIAAFQVSIGVEPTGILDEATLRAIYQAGFEAGGGATTTTTVPATTVPDTTVPDTTVPETTPDTTPETTASATTTPDTTTPDTIPAVEPGSILDALVSDAEGRFTQLVAILEQPDLAEVRAALNDPTTTDTLFAPTNDAIASSPAVPADQLVAVITYHLVPGEALDPLSDNDFETAQGEQLTVEGSAVPQTVTDANGGAAEILVPVIEATASRVWAIASVLRPANP